MKHLLIISVCFSSLFCTAQTTPKKNNTEQEIRKLMKDWTIAIMKRDEKTLNKIVAPEYKLDGTYPFDQPPVTRKMWMTNLQLLRFDSAHYYDMKVDVIDNVAIVQSKSFWSGKFGDRPPFVDSTCMLVDTWMKRKQGWQVVSRLRVDKPE
jgi:hypothetical protein